MEISNLTEGEWFCAIEGIAIVERIYNFYFEEYSCIPRNKNYGDYNLSMVQYKLFCDFDGHPIKRNRFKIFNMAYCSPINSKWEKVLKKSINENPKEYTSFIKLRNIKESKGCVMLTYTFSKNTKNKITLFLEQIQRQLPPKFTFLDLLKTAVDNGNTINMMDFIDDTYDLSSYIRIYLDYIYGDYVGKRVLFHNFEYEIEEK